MPSSNSHLPIADTRTRFAPSPTGYIHVGGIRTALFAFLVARQQGGTFILRLEDTDQKREVVGSAEHIISSLTSLHITHDEGPDIGGPYAPYKQSERLDTYRRWAQKLIDSGRAYADPYTPDQIQAFREQASANKQPFLYRTHRPDNPPAWDGTTPLRFRSEPTAYDWHDEVMGDLHTGPEVIDDFILVKSDGYPTYNFAHIVDDAEMHVSHVIRGQEFISSMPNYLNLYEALGIERPILCHVPHILNEHGNKKLGKRDGAKDVLDYVRDGYVPEALIGFIATLGWNDGSEQEIFTMDELIEKFSLSKIQRSGARFDEKRLLWMNGQWIRRLELDDLYERVESYWPEAAKAADESYRRSVLGLVQDRLKTLAELPGMTQYFFEEPRENWSLITDNKQLSKLERSEIDGIITATKNALESTDWSTEAIQATLNQLLVDLDLKPGVLFGLIRVVTTWAPFSPELPATLALLGKEKTLDRICRVIS